MIVISRKKNETIVIGDVCVTVFEIRGDKVRLCISTPRGVSVHRQEVYEALHGVNSPDLPTICESDQSDQQVHFVEISLDQLVSEMGASEADVPQNTRFTNEGGIPL